MSSCAACVATWPFEARLAGDSAISRLDCTCLGLASKEPLAESYGWEVEGAEELGEDAGVHSVQGGV